MLIEPLDVDVFCTRNLPLTFAPSADLALVLTVGGSPK